jgi:triosephosphate isomerase (TIM)
MKPMIIVNFKAYVAGKDTMRLSALCDKVARDTRANIVVAPSFVDVASVARDTSISVYAQHVDGVDLGAHTGQVNATMLHSVGVNGVLINHSEWPISLNEIVLAVTQCKKEKLTTVVCAASLDMIATIVGACVPDFIAYEPPELIGGNVSVTSASPDLVKDAVALVTKNSSTKVLCGAGVKTGKDVAVAMELGCVGVLVASGVVKAKNQEKALRDLVKGP